MIFSGLGGIIFNSIKLKSKPPISSSYIDSDGKLHLYGRTPSGFIEQIYRIENAELVGEKYFDTH